MKKQVVKIIDVNASGLPISAVVLTLAFLVGACFGFVLSGQANKSVNLEFIAYMETFLTAIKLGTAEQPSLWIISRELFIWPLATVFMGFSPLGVVSIPILFSMRGFSMAFAIGSLVHLFGVAGLALAAILLGVVSAVSLPVFFVLGKEHFVLAKEMARQWLGYSKQGESLGGRYLAKSMICFVVLISCVMLELFAVPTLLSSVMLLF